MLSAWVLFYLMWPWDSALAAKSSSGVTWKRVDGKRVDTVLASPTARSARHCTMRCLAEAGCDSVNVRQLAGGVQCELLNNTAAGWVDASDSDVTHYVPVVAYGGAWYHFGRDVCTWAACRERCRALGLEGADLLLVNSTEEQDFIAGHVGLDEGLQYSIFWLNIKETTGTAPGVWVTGDGGSIPYYHWIPHLTFIEEFQCGAAVQEEYYNWWDEDCNMEANFICKTTLTK